MYIESEIVARLKSFAGTAALSGDRVYPLVLPTDTAPAITYRRLSGVPEHTLDGGVAFTSIQLEICVWGGRYEQVRVLADAVFAALDGWDNGAGVAVLDVQFGPDLYEPEVPDLVRYRCLLEVDVFKG